MKVNGLVQKLKFFKNTLQQSFILKSLNTNTRLPKVIMKPHNFSSSFLNLFLSVIIFWDYVWIDWKNYLSDFIKKLKMFVWNVLWSTEDFHCLKIQRTKRMKDESRYFWNCNQPKWFWKNTYHAFNFEWWYKWITVNQSNSPPCYGHIWWFLTQFSHQRFP